MVNGLHCPHGVDGQYITTSMDFFSNGLGEPMSQVSNSSLIDRYGESLHSSEVINVRELKFCEGCGVLLVRLRGSKARFCSECDQAMAIAMERTQ